MSESKNFVVLLVEDEPADVYLTRQSFKEGRLLVDVHDVPDGVEALAFLQREGQYQDAPRPDLILLDLNMPRMDGKTFLRRVKAIDALKPIPVVMLTTSEAESDIVETYTLGAAGYVVKPIELAQFIRATQTLEDYWLTLVRRPDA